MKSHPSATLLIALTALLSPNFIFGEPSAVTFESGDTQVSLLELFSSEGCSSCPPAEQWFTTLKAAPTLWKEFVPVCFHVDYWDYLGWRDILDSKSFTLRQQYYAQTLGMNSIYTPGFMLNGREWKGWYDGERAPPASSFKPGNLRVTLRKPLALTVTFKPTDGSKKWRVEAALLAMGVVSHVTAGENSGRTLQHDFAVIRHTTQALTAGDGGFTAILSFAAPTMNSPATALAVWVVKDGDTTPVQAAGGLVPNEFIR